MTLSKVQPPWAGYAVMRDHGGRIFLSTWLPSTTWEDAGSVQTVTVSSGLPVMPVCDSQDNLRAVLPVATITELRAV